MLTYAIIEFSTGITHQFSFFTDLSSAEQAANLNSPGLKKKSAIIAIEDLNGEIKVSSVRTASKYLKVYEPSTYFGIYRSFKPIWEETDITALNSDLVDQLITQYKYYVLPSCRLYAIITGSPSNYYLPKKTMFYLYDCMTSSFILGYPIKSFIRFFADRDVAEANGSAKDLLIEFEAKGDIPQKILNYRGDDSIWKEVDLEKNDLPVAFKKEFEQYLFLRDIEKTPNTNIKHTHTLNKMKNLHAKLCSYQDIR